MNQVFDDVQNTLKSVPLITRYILVTTVALSLSLQLGVIQAKQVTLVTSQIFNFQMYRLFTNMCLSSGLDL